MPDCCVADCAVEGDTPLVVGPEVPPDFPLVLPLPERGWAHLAVCEQHATMIADWQRAEMIRTFPQRAFMGYL